MSERYQLNEKSKLQYDMYVIMLFRATPISNAICKAHVNTYESTQKWLEGYPLNSFPLDWGVKAGEGSLLCI